MSVSTDGILCYGIALDDEEPPPRIFWDEENDDEVYPIPEDWPAELVRHCSHDYPEYIVAMKGTVTTARRGYPEIINELDDILPDAKVLEFVRWCGEHGIEGESHWYLCSFWG